MKAQSDKWRGDGSNRKIIIIKEQLSYTSNIIIG
jgi:hypothetical protein